MEAEYKSDGETRVFTVDPSGAHSTLGQTTKSSIVIAGYIDKDTPSVPDNSRYLGKLRSMMTTLQDDINVYLTEKMGVGKEDDVVEDAEEGNEDDD